MIRKLLNGLVLICFMAILVLLIAWATILPMIGLIHLYNLI